MKSFYLFLLIPIMTLSQSADSLQFSTRFYDAVDQYVLLNSDDKNYSLGFVYIDEQAGFTFNWEGNTLKMTSTGLVLQDKVDENLNMKVRLEPNWQLVHPLSNEEVVSLGLPEQPEWLEVYKANSDTNDYQLAIGYFYNHVGASIHAISYLENVYNDDPSFRNVIFELSYAYNATKQFDKAIAMLEKALKEEPKLLIYKELGYSYLNTKNYEKSVEAYSKGLELEGTDQMKAEMALPIAQHFFNVGDEKEFKKWSKLSKKYSKKIPQFLQYLNYWNENFKVKK